MNRTVFSLPATSSYKTAGGLAVTRAAAPFAGGKALDEAVARIMSAFGDRPYIFNLGHGITPQTPIAHVEKLLKLVRAAG